MDFLRAQPVFTLFLVLALGHLLGRLRIGPVSLGPVAGVLFVGLFFGHLGFTMTPGAQAVGFALFIFAVGYQAGPRWQASTGSTPAGSPVASGALVKMPGKSARFQSVGAQQPSHMANGTFLAIFCHFCSPRFYKNSQNFAKSA